VSDAKSIMVDVSENCKVKSVPAAMWRCIKDSVNTLVDADVGSDVKHEVGRILLHNISLLEKQNSHAKSQKCLQDRCATVIEYLNELREHVHVTVGKIITVVEKAALVDEQSENFWKRIALMEERIRIMDNVNSNFRKIMKLENDFLRDLLRADRETIGRMRAKLITLQRKLRSIDSSDGDCGSDSSVTIVAEEQEDRMPIVEPAHQDEIMQEENPSRLMNDVTDDVSDSIVSNFNKEDILRILGVQKEATNTS